MGHGKTQNERSFAHMSQWRTDLVSNLQYQMMDSPHCDSAYDQDKLV